MKKEFISLESEVRDGFYIRSMMKRVWSVQMSMLSEIDQLCRKNNIHYFAESGTLLGAVRHKGYIPWDDDIDLVFLRKDFRRFRELAETEFSSKFYFLNDYGSDKIEFSHRLVNGFKITTEPEYLNENYGCPYIVGIDLFILDELPGKASEKELWVSLLSNGINLAYLLEYDANYESLTDETRLAVSAIENTIGVHFDYGKPIRSQLLNALETLAMSYEGSGSEEICIIPFFENVMKSKWYRDAINMQFESLEVYVPIDYDNVLKTTYGNDYMTPIQGLAMHNYPGFANQEKQLFEAYKDRGLPIPEQYLD